MKTMRYNVKVSPQRRIGAALLAVVVFAMLTHVVPAEVPMIKLDSARQLFLDAYLIDKMDNVYRVPHQPIKCAENPLLLPEKPWEGKSASPNLIVFDKKEKKYKLWYTCAQWCEPASWIEELKKSAIKYTAGRGFVVPGMDIRYQKRNNRYAVYTQCYATSTDGVHFDKPRLGLIPFPPSEEETNLVAFRPVLDDPHDPLPERRFKAVIGTGDASKAMGVAWSADGVHWREHPENPVVDTAIGGGSIIWDDRIQKYVGYFRPRPFPFSKVSKRPIRMVGRSVSPDFIHWSPLPQENVVLEPDNQDGFGVEFYQMRAFKYENCYIGFLWVYRQYTDKVKNLHPEGFDMTLDTQLVFSRDGEHWTRVCDRQVFIPRGKPGSWDEMELYTYGMVERENAIQIYYSGSISGHGHRSSSARSTLVAGRTVTGGIGLATLRLDGFVSVNAGHHEGALTTKTVNLNGGQRLFINAKTLNGYVLVEILNQFGKPVEGFERENCIPVTGDSVEFEVRWKGGMSLSRLKSKPIRLRFIMKNAELYSFKFSS